MAKRIQGLDELKREVEDAAKFGEALNRLKVKCDLLSPESLEAGLCEMDEAVEREARLYPRNKVVRVLADGAKKALREGTLKEAAKAQGK